jgi:hypothetical protein
LDKITDIQIYCILSSYSGRRNFVYEERQLAFFLSPSDLGRHNYFLLNPVQGSLIGRLTHWKPIVLLIRIPGFFRPGLVALMKTGGGEFGFAIDKPHSFFYIEPPGIDFLSVSIEPFAKVSHNSPFGIFNRQKREFVSILSCRW